MSTRNAAAPASARTYRNFIGGGWVEAEAPRTVPNFNPADTREVMGMIPLSSPDDARCGPPRNTALPPMPNGRSSSGTSNAARSPQASAAAPSPPPASTNTPASAAPCSGPTRRSDRESPRSATT